MPFIGEIAGIGSAFCFAACAMFFTYASHRIGSFSMSHFRMLFGVIMIAGLHVAINGDLFPASITTQNWTLLALSGLTGYFLCDTFLFQCYVDASPRIGSLIFNIYPFVSTVLAWVFLKEHLPALAIIGITMTIAGMTWVALEKGAGNLHIGKLHYKRGVLFAVGAGVLQGVSFVLAKPALEGVGAVDPLTATLIRAVFGGAAFWIVSILRGRIVTVIKKARDWRSIAMTFCGALIGAVIGVWLSMIAVQKAPVGIATTLIATYPIMILPMTAIFHREKISWRAIIGAIIACLGVAILFNS